MKLFLPLLLLLAGCGKDWRHCEPTQETQAQHRPMWIQVTPRVCANNVCTGGLTIIHPSRDWTERMWVCPDGKYWRVE